MSFEKFYKGRRVFDHDGYEEIIMPEHHTARANGTVFVHTLVAEEKLGRYLNKHECVHHIDGCRNNNVPSNLLVFKTSKDHANYHIAMKNNLDFKLDCLNGVCTCRIIYSKEKQNLLALRCPVCGGRKSKGAKMCKSCRIQYNLSTNVSKLSNLDKGTLSKLLSEYSMEHIGRMYGVTGAAIKKRAKKFGIYIPKIKDCNDVNLFMSQLQLYGKRTVARNYNLNVSVINTWINRYGIIIIPKYYECVETEEHFSNRNEAGRCKYPLVNYRTAAKHIDESCKTGVTYMGYTWVYHEKQVRSEVFSQA